MNTAICADSFVLHGVLQGVQKKMDTLDTSRIYYGFWRGTYANHAASDAARARLDYLCRLSFSARPMLVVGTLAFVPRGIAGRFRGAVAVVSDHPRPGIIGGQHDESGLGGGKRQQAARAVRPRRTFSTAHRESGAKRP